METFCQCNIILIQWLLVMVEYEVSIWMEIFPNILDEWNFLKRSRNGLYEVSTLNGCASRSLIPGNTARKGVFLTFLCH